MARLAVISGYACMGSEGRKPAACVDWDFAAYTSAHSVHQHCHRRDVWGQESNRRQDLSPVPATPF